MSQFKRSNGLTNQDQIILLKALKILKILNLHFHKLKRRFLLDIIRCKKRDQLIEYLKLNGISSSVHLKPLPLLSVYKKYNSKVPNAKKIWKELVSLPLFPELKKNQVKYIIKVIKYFDNHYKKF